MKVFSRLALAAVAILATGQAFANLAATHIIRNEVSVDFSDAANVFVGTVTASTDITVNLVAVAPDAVIDAGASSTLNPVSTNDTITLVFNITSNANGLDTYEMKNTAFSGGASGNGESVSSGPNTVPLGGSTATAVVTTFETANVAIGAGTDIVVPADSVGGDSAINGFVIGDTIVLAATGGTPGDIVCVVNNVTEPAFGSEANATATIEVDQCVVPAGATLGIGDQLGERGTITLDITVGSVAGTLNFDADVDFVGSTGTATAIAQVVITIVATDLNVYKFVRNTDTAENPTCAATHLNCLLVDSTTYYRSGVTANPGDTLQYAILLFNAGTVDVKVIKVTDDIAPFTTFDTGTIDLVPRGTAADNAGNCESVGSPTGTCTVTNTENSATPTATDAAGDDYGALVAGTPDTVTVSGGHDGLGDAVATEIVGGQLGVGEVSVVKFSVTVD